MFLARNPKFKLFLSIQQKWLRDHVGDDLPPYKTFCTDETLKESRYSILIFIQNVQRIYINDLQANFRQTLSIHLYSISEKQDQHEETFQKNRCFVEPAPNRMLPRPLKSLPV